MADNVAITAGSGTNVAADDIASVFYQRVKLSLGADGTAVDAIAGAGIAGTGVMRVTLATDDAAIATLKRNLIAPANGTFTRPANTTAYSIGDLIANNVTAGSVTPFSFTGATKTGSGGSGRITQARLYKSGSVSCSIRAHFLKTSHAVTNGDNGALVFTSLDIDNYIGMLDFDFFGSALTAIGSGGGELASSVGPPLDYVLSSTDTIYVFLQAIDAFTPANAGTFDLRIAMEVYT